MAQRRSEEFMRDAVRIALTSGLPRQQVAADLGVGLSSLTRWIGLYGDREGAPAGDQALARENERLRRELRIVTEEREVLKKATAFFASQKR